MIVSRIPERIGWAVGVGIVCTVVYRSLQYAFVSKAEMRGACWAWTWLPFNSMWVWPYFSMFVLVGLPWFLLPDVRQVRRFAWTLLGAAAVGWVTFIVYPTACERPPVEGQGFAYQLLRSHDEANNCMPCLHSAFAVLSAWVLFRSVRAFGNVFGASVLVLWLAVMFISIVALRQHTDVDTAVGALLGAAAAGVYGWAVARCQVAPLPESDRGL